jgi:hypothetical protein
MRLTARSPDRTVGLTEHHDGARRAVVMPVRVECPSGQHEVVMPTNRAGRAMRSRRVRLLLASAASVVCLLSAVACRTDVTEVAGPGGTPGGTPGDSTSDTTGTGGGVQRITLTVTITIDPADTVIARQLGLTGGLLADAEVVARRSGSSDRATGRTDSQGVVRLANLLPGTWSISAGRAIDDAARATLPEIDRDVTGWSAGGTVTASASRDSSIVAVAGRRGSLVISEWFAYAPPTASYSAHPWGQYLELYNNSDTTIYLDGKIFGRMVPNFLNDFPTFPCSVTAPLRLRPSGVWARTAARLPGTGLDFPLRPGQAQILVTDAADHRPYNPTLLDLSDADFEFYMGAGDVDNPVAANMIPLTFISGVENHGPSFWSSDLYFIADASSQSELRDSVYQHANGQIDMVFVPRLLDVVAQDYATSAPGLYPMCAPLVNATLDRASGRMLDFRSATSMRRPMIGTSSLGHPLLQRTRSSERDFVRGLPTPHTVP